MGALSWPSEEELNGIRKIVSEMAGRSVEEVRVAVSPYRICPLGAHIDHQGGTVTAMTIDKGILLGFVPSGDTRVVLRSGQFKGEVRFRVDETHHPRQIIQQNGVLHSNDSSSLQEECRWGNYARGAVYSLKSRGNELLQGIIGYICGTEGLDSSGVSSSAASVATIGIRALRNYGQRYSFYNGRRHTVQRTGEAVGMVGVAYLLAFESANNITVSPTENIEYDRLIENEYLGLRNGILDQSAILLSHHGCLTCMDCKTKEYKLVHPPKLQKTYKLLLAFSGLKHALTNNPGYNCRVAECQEAARILLHASGNQGLEPLLSNVKPEAYEAHKCQLESNLAKRAEHYFSENMRVAKGLEAWASGNLEDFGKLIAASGLSSIKNYECGSEPLIQLYEILLRAPGIYGARFSGAGFRGCCLAIVDADRVDEAASFVREEYVKLQPKLACQRKPHKGVLICDAGDCARVI